MWLEDILVPWVHRVNVEAGIESTRHTFLYMLYIVETDAIDWLLSENETTTRYKSLSSVSHIHTCKKRWWCAAYQMSLV